MISQADALPVRTARCKQNVATLAARRKSPLQKSAHLQFNMIATQTAELAAYKFVQTLIRFQLVCSPAMHIMAGKKRARV